MWYTLWANGRCMRYFPATGSLRVSVGLLLVPPRSFWVWPHTHFSTDRGKFLIHLLFNLHARESKHTHAVKQGLSEGSISRWMLTDNEWRMGHISEYPPQRGSRGPFEAGFSESRDLWSPFCSFLFSGQSQWNFCSNATSASTPVPSNSPAASELTQPCMGGPSSGALTTLASPRCDLSQKNLSRRCPGGSVPRGHPESIQMLPVSVSASCVSAALNPIPPAACNAWPSPLRRVRGKVRIWVG